MTDRQSGFGAPANMYCHIGIRPAGGRLLVALTSADARLVRQLHGLHRMRWLCIITRAVMLAWRRTPMHPPTNTVKVTLVNSLPTVMSV